MAAVRTDRGKTPGTQAAFTSEGVVADGAMQIEVIVTLGGSPAAVQADYATLLTNVAALATAKTVNWKKH